MVGIKETVAELTGRVTDLYRELVTNTVQFQELRNYTKEKRHWVSLSIC